MPTAVTKSLVVTPDCKPRTCSLTSALDSMLMTTQSSWTVATSFGTGMESRAWRLNGTKLDNSYFVFSFYGKRTQTNNHSQQLKGKTEMKTHTRERERERNYPTVAKGTLDKAGPTAWSKQASKALTHCDIVADQLVVELGLEAPAWINLHPHGQEGNGRGHTAIGDCSSSGQYNNGVNAW